MEGTWIHDDEWNIHWPMHGSNSEINFRIFKSKIAKEAIALDGKEMSPFLVFVEIRNWRSTSRDKYVVPR
jgi:hypothetical protein